MLHSVLQLAANQAGYSEVINPSAAAGNQIDESCDTEPKSKVFFYHL